VVHEYKPRPISTVNRFSSVLADVNWRKFPTRGFIVGSFKETACTKHKAAVFGFNTINDRPIVDIIIIGKTHCSRLTRCQLPLLPHQKAGMLFLMLVSGQKHISVLLRQ